MVFGVSFKSTDMWDLLPGIGGPSRQVVLDGLKFNSFKMEGELCRKKRKVSMIFSIKLLNIEQSCNGKVLNCRDHCTSSTQLLPPLYLPLCTFTVAFILALTGATMGSMICYIFPAVMYISVMSMSKSGSKPMAQVTQLIQNGKEASGSNL